jgi:hypothetical protein
MFWRMLQGKPRVAPIAWSASGSVRAGSEQRVVPVLGEEEVRTRLYGRERIEHPAPLAAASAPRPRADRHSG